MDTGRFLRISYNKNIFWHLMLMSKESHGPLLRIYSAETVSFSNLQLHDAFPKQEAQRRPGRVCGRDSHIWAGLAERRVSPSGLHVLQRPKGLQGDSSEGPRRPGPGVIKSQGMTIPSTRMALSRVCPPEVLGSPRIMGVGGVPERKTLG